MIDAAQIRAARGLLNWSQTDLSKRADISVNWISRIEHGEAGSIGMLEKIQDTFEKAGVEFLSRSGVRKKHVFVEIYEGDDSEKRLIDDIQKTVLNTGNDSSSKREILIAHLKEDEARRNLGTDDMDGTKYIEKLIHERREAGITHRLLVRADDQGLFEPYDTYHIMPNQYFSDHPLYIYGTKLAILAWHPAKSVVIDDERFADCARKLFNFIWDHTEVVRKEGKGVKAAN